MKQKKNIKLNYLKNGFTLIELLTTISIITLLMIIAIPSFRTYKYRNDLERGAQLVQSGIYQARNYALAPLADKDSNANSYAIKINKDSNSFQIFESNYVINEDNSITCTLSEILINTFTLSSNVSFTSSNKTICFSIVEQGKIMQTDNSDIAVILANSKLSDEERILTINWVTGQVMINK